MYWNTYFYANGEDDKSRVLLGFIDPILDEGDVKRGYVLKKELLSWCKTKIHEEDITERSRIIEFMVTTYGTEEMKTREFEIKDM